MSGVIFGILGLSNGFNIFNDEFTLLLGFNGFKLDCTACVFGCGGNRDAGKRPLMGQIATQHADWSIVTTDNPRHEDPAMIIQDIVQGIDSSNYQIIVDRKQAIIAAIQQAKVGDVVLVAGKGHEDYQEIKGVKHHFSDLELVAELLNEKI